jgi:hypothetical protein
MEIPELDEEGKTRVEAVLRRAADDIQFRMGLMNDPESTLADTDLTAEEKRLVASMRRVGLEEWGVDVRPFRAFLRDNGNKITALDFVLSQEEFGAGPTKQG